jgi:pimeloyl-ACP methyl ester carboxylesterase
VENVQLHDDAPYRVVVVHGGPGATGEMEPVATELASDTGVLEPFQTATTVDGQITELANVIKTHGDPPVLLVGYSWGAFLAALTTEAHPNLVERIVLVGCPPLENSYVPEISSRRVKRLSDEDAERYSDALEIITGSTEASTDAALADLNQLAQQADTYGRIEDPPELDVDVDVSQFQSVWEEAAAMRTAGDLLNAVADIERPVLLLHGHYDSHPLAGVTEPLDRVDLTFKTIELDKCGHTPWLEIHARDRFFDLLFEEIRALDESP